MIFKPIDDVERNKIFLTVKDACSDNMCYEFALSIHKFTGLPIVGLWSDSFVTDNGTKGTWRHVGIKISDTHVLDADGIQPSNDFAIKFKDTIPEIVPIAKEDILSIRPMRESLILDNMIQTLYPDLPWKETTYFNRCRTFLEELEILSKKYNIWIRSQYPTSKAILSDTDETKSPYYEGDVTAMGHSVVFDRLF